MRVIVPMIVGRMSAVLVIVFDLAVHFYASSAFHPELAFHLFCTFQPLEGQEAIRRLGILPFADFPLGALAWAPPASYDHALMVNSVIMPVSRCGM
ncbi:hypothetical protein [Paracoccus aminovorans]|uniref:hypothetical protein n=1 Tax=Paracoccus aminovorans TaxID=34004 RepID=UPI00147C1A0C|nr:hypothetical protein [Paracoccus aminovorans]